MGGERALRRIDRHLYAAGLFGINCLGLVITGWVLKYYYPDEPGVPNLVPLGWAGYILLIGRLSDGLNDPLIGWLSDRSRTPFGRRKPFMAAGLPGLCACFLLLWHPPQAAASPANFWFGAGVLVLFFIAFTLYAGPYFSLLPDIVATSDERAALSGLQAVYGLVGFITGSLIPAVTLARGQTLSQTALITVLVCLPFLLAPFAGPRDRGPAAAEPTPPFFRSVTITLRNVPFQRYVVSQLLFQMGLLIIVTALPYVVPVLLGRDKAYAAHLTGVALVSGIAFVPLILRRARARGMKHAYRFAMVWFAGTSLLLVLLTPLGRTAFGIWLAFGVVVLIGVAVGGLYALPNAILADVTAHDQQLTGLQRQGMFYCVQGLVLKLAYSLSPWVVDLLNTRVAPRELGLSLVGPVAGLCCLAGAWVFGGFPEDEVRAAVRALATEPADE